MKYLIVNGDDFGATPGITRGILEAHQRGILTSTSLLVNRPSSAEAARLGRDLPRLSVGLHVDLTERGDPDRCRAELHQQLDRFVEFVGRLPSHLDAHHNAHHDVCLCPAFLELARQHRLPLRGYSPVRYFAQFYGQWDGVTHLEQVSVESLVRMLKIEVGEGWTELSCHPGYVDADWSSGYSQEREAELRTLCDPRVRAALEERQIRLVSFHDCGGRGLDAGAPEGKLSWPPL
jgi:chitin disaccharide deacetylase